MGYASNLEGLGKGRLEQSNLPAECYGCVPAKACLRLAAGEALRVKDDPIRSHEIMLNAVDTHIQQVQGCTGNPCLGEAIGIQTS